MEILFCKNKDIDRKAWDDCIDASLNTQVYAFSWYLDATAGNWDALVYGNYEAVMPLTYRRKMGIEYLYQPYFVQQLGIFSKEKLKETESRFFFNEVIKNYRFADIYVNASFLPKQNDFNAKPRKNHILDLNANYEILKKPYSISTRRNIQKAANEGLHLKTMKAELVLELFKAFNPTNNLAEPDYKAFLNLVKAAQSNAETIIEGVFNHKEELQSAGIFILSSKRLYYLMGASTGDGKKAGAMHFLFDSLIQQFAGQEMTFDFEGSEIEGVARFFKSFGAIESVYYHLKMNRLPFPLKLLKR